MDGIARFDLPQAEVFCLTDGGLDFAPEVFADLPAERLAARLIAAGEATIRTEFNAFLIRHEGLLTLVDAGCGGLYGDNGGRLPGLLAALGVAPDQIDTLVFTHLHGDHCGGALRDGVPVFPNARVLMHADERAHWQGKPEAAGQVIAACADRIALLADGDCIAPGLTVWALPGHTPGHIGLRLGDSFALLGDVLHSDALQLPDPETATIYDTDTAQARHSRRAALAEVAARALVFSGSHMLGPQKFARLLPKGAGYRAVAP